jgi:uncharacterized protein YjbI with pentapeptide repeats
MIHDHVRRQGQNAWNKWRLENPAIAPDLSGAELSGLDLVFHPPLGDNDYYYHDISPRVDGLNLGGAHLDHANLAGTQLQGAYLAAATLQETNLTRANLIRAELTSALVAGANLIETNLGGAFAKNADFRKAHLHGANLGGASLSRAVFREAQLDEARLRGADLQYAVFDGADLSQADLIGSDLTYASFLNVNMRGTQLRYANVYGTNVWDCDLTNAVQESLSVSPPSKYPQIEADDLALAQFTYVLMCSDSLRAIGDVLRGLGYRPMLFDFDRPDDRNYTETVKTLVGLARFVIVDLTGPSVPQELYATVPHFKIPFIPIIQAGARQYAMFLDLLEYPWVLKPIVYSEANELLATVRDEIVAPAEQQISDRQAKLEAIFDKR